MIKQTEQCFDSTADATYLELAVHIKVGKRCYFKLIVHQNNFQYVINVLFQTNMTNMFYLYNEKEWGPKQYQAPLTFIVWTKNINFMFHRRKVTQIWSGMINIILVFGYPLTSKRDTLPQAVSKSVISLKNVLWFNNPLISVIWPQEWENTVVSTEIQLYIVSY